MRYHYPIFSFFFLPWLFSCAALGVGSYSREDSWEDDPVAQIALSYAHPIASKSLFEHSVPKAEQDRFQQEGAIQYALSSGELVLGMRMPEVLAVWGEPREIETAGLREAGNQRWIYYEGLSSRWSISSTRIIYFESGQVTGWSTR